MYFSKLFAVVLVSGVISMPAKRNMSGSLKVAEGVPVETLNFDKRDMNGTIGMVSKVQEHRVISRPLANKTDTLTTDTTTTVISQMKHGSNKLKRALPNTHSLFRVTNEHFPPRKDAKNFTGSIFSVTKIFRIIQDTKKSIYVSRDWLINDSKEGGRRPHQGQHK